MCHREPIRNGWTVKAKREQRFVPYDRIRKAEHAGCPAMLGGV